MYFQNRKYIYSHIFFLTIDSLSFENPINKLLLCKTYKNQQHAQIQYLYFLTLLTGQGNGNLAFHRIAPCAEDNSSHISTYVVDIPLYLECNLLTAIILFPIFSHSLSWLSNWWVSNPTP